LAKAKNHKRPCDNGAKATGSKVFVVAFKKPNNIRDMFWQLVAGSGQSPVN